MISTICVFNNQELFAKRLSESIQRQSVPHEFIALDNRDCQFRSAAQALNFGAAQANGEWLVFAHQDITLFSNEWLATAENYLRQYKPAGWSGVAGMTERGEFRGFILDCARLLGSPFEAPIPVQTLDECILIHRREVLGYTYFDVNLSGWHQYGVEACIRAVRSGQQNYVLPLLAWHDSMLTNVKGIDEALRYVWEKHGNAVRPIFSNCGTLPDSLKGKQATDAMSFLERLVAKERRRLNEQIMPKFLRQCGLDVLIENSLGPILESLTETDEFVESVDKCAPHDSITAQGFVPRPRRPRRIVHYFNGLESGVTYDGCVVIMPRLAKDLIKTGEHLYTVFTKAPRVICCVKLSHLALKPETLQLFRKEHEVRLIVLKWGRSSYCDQFLTPLLVIGHRRDRR